MKALSKFVWMLLLIIFVGACSSNDEEPPTNQEVENSESENPVHDTKPSPYRNIVLSDDERYVVGMNNAFAFRLWEVINDNIDGSEDIALSPSSVFSVLSMMANGDSGETRDEVMKILVGDGKIDLSEINIYNSHLLKELTDIDNRVTFATANSLWIQNGCVIDPAYSALLDMYYGTEMFNCHLDGEEGRAQINSWVAEKTNNLIVDFLKMPLLNVKLGFLNALYFCGQWSIPFDKENSKEGEFRGNNGLSRVVYMTSEDNQLYGKTDNLEMIGLHYGSGNFRIWLILPSVGYEQILSYDKYQECRDALQLSSVSLSLPRFSSEFNCDLLEVLKVMGLNKAISSLGFNSMLANKEPLYPGFMKHAVSIYVTEDGTKAGAATMAGMASSPGDPEEIKTVELKFDRPFHYVIEETSTGTILFVGSVRNV